MPEFLITDSGERVEIPSAVVGQSDRRNLVAQYVKASPDERKRIAAGAQRDADAAAAKHAAAMALEAKRRDLVIALHQRIASGELDPTDFDAALASELATLTSAAVATAADANDEE